MKLKGARLARGQFSPRTARAFYHRGELFPLQRLDEITVATCFQNGIALNVIDAAGHDNDLWRIKFFPDCTTDLKAADPGQQQITKDHVGPVLEGKVDSGRAVFCFDRIPAMTREKARDALTAFRIVFNE